MKDLPRKSRELIAVILVVALMALPTSPCSAAVPVGPLDGKEPQALTIQHLRTAQEQQLTTKELVELSFAYLMLRKFELAELTARVALGTTHNPKQRAAILALVAQNLALMGRYQEAGDVALSAQRLDPNSKTLAAYRVAFFDKAGDVLQKQAALEYLKKLDPSGREPVMSLKVFAVASGVIISAVLVIFHYATGNPNNDKEFYAALGDIWKAVGAVAISPLP